MQKATVDQLEQSGTSFQQWQEFISDLEAVGASVPTMTTHALAVAAVFAEDMDSRFLTRSAACGAGYPYRRDPRSPDYKVPNYVKAEHAHVMTAEISKEKLAGNIVHVPGDWLIQGKTGLGLVSKLRLGKVKWRPVWDYSRPAVVGVNDRIDVEKSKFSSVRDAFALMRPGLYMAKVDLTAAYRSLPLASQYWETHVFEWEGATYADTRAPFGNSAMPGVFSRFTKVIVRFMQSKGASIVGYLDDFLLVGERAKCKEFMFLLIELVRFIGFDVNLLKCEGPRRRIEFLGVELCTVGEECTASISEERIAAVEADIAEVRHLHAQGRLPRRKLESLLGVLGFCGQVVWGLSLYTRHGHTLLSATRHLRYIKLNSDVLQDLKVISQVLRLYNGRKVVLHRREVKRDWFSTDASTEEGMGAVLDDLFFSLTWEQLKQLPQRPFYPFREGVPESFVKADWLRSATLSSSQFGGLLLCGGDICKGVMWSSESTTKVRLAKCASGGGPAPTSLSFENCSRAVYGGTSG